MERQTPPAAFDLRAFAPPRQFTFTLRSTGETYTIQGDPDVDDVAVMLRIDTEIDEKTGLELGAAMAEGKREIRRMIQLAEPDRDLDGFTISPDEVVLVLALVCHGSTVAEAVGHALTQANAPALLAAGDGGDGDRGDDGGAGAEGGDELPLERRSSERSLSSDESTAGHLVTGTA